MREVQPVTRNLSTSLANPPRFLYNYDTLKDDLKVLLAAARSRGVRGRKYGGQDVDLPGSISGPAVYGAPRQPVAAKEGVSWQ